MTKSFDEVATEVGRLVSSKHKQYGDAFGRAGSVLRILYPNGIRPDQMDDALAITRIVDKLFRIAQRGQNGHDLGGESPYRDIMGYGLLGAVRDQSDPADPVEAFTEICDMSPEEARQLLKALRLDTRYPR